MFFQKMGFYEQDVMWNCTSSSSVKILQSVRAENGFAAFRSRLESDS
jgi:hypothetical protein